MTIGFDEISFSNKDYFYLTCKLFFMRSTTRENDENLLRLHIVTFVTAGFFFKTNTHMSFLPAAKPSAQVNKSFFFVGPV